MSGIPNTLEHKQNVVEAITELGGFQIVYHHDTGEVKLFNEDGHYILSFNEIDHPELIELAKSNLMFTLRAKLLDEWTDEIAEALLVITFIGEDV